MSLQKFPFPLGDPFHPVSAYVERRATCPFGLVEMPTGHEALLVTKYRDAAAVFGDSRFSHDLTAPGSARPFAVVGPSYFDDPTNIINMEGPRHRRIRRLVAPAFTPRAVRRWQSIVEQTAVDLLDQLEAQPRPADLIEQFCFPLPVRIICRILGVPEADSGRFKLWSSALLSGAEMTSEQQIALVGEFYFYITELVAAKRKDPGSDLIDEMIAARDDEDKLTEDELVALILGLVAAGNETTSNSLSRYVVTLLRDDRKLWRALVDDPELIPAAVDELARFTTLGPAPALRIATEDIDLPSGRVAAGRVVVIPGDATMRDADDYPDPDAVIFDRAKIPSLAFGSGPHMCLGVHLALLELRTALQLLTTRMPELRLAAEPEDLPFSNGVVLNSLVRLPVAW